MIATPALALPDYLPDLLGVYGEASTGVHTLRAFRLRYSG